MEPVAEFFRDNIVIVYFFYGLSFFCMGLFILVESDRTSTFRLAQLMRPLAGFGIIHGLHEWFEMFQNIPNSVFIPQWVLSESLRLTHLVVSFVLLLIIRHCILHCVDFLFFWNAILHCKVNLWQWAFCFQAARERSAKSCHSIVSVTPITIVGWCLSLYHSPPSDLW